MDLTAQAVLGDVPARNSAANAPSFPGGWSDMHPFCDKAQDRAEELSGDLEKLIRISWVLPCARCVVGCCEAAVLVLDTAGISIPSELRSSTSHLGSRLGGDPSYGDDVSLESSQGHVSPRRRRCAAMGML